MPFRVRNRFSLAIIVACVAIGVACAREPTDPSRSDLTGRWQSYDVALHISSITLELIQPSPGIIVGKWFALGHTDNSCTPGVFCADSSLVTGRNEVAQVIMDLLGAGTFIGVLARRDSLDGVIKAEGKNFHVAFKKVR